MAVSPIPRHPTCTFGLALHPFAERWCHHRVRMGSCPIFTVLFTPKDAAEVSWPNFRSHNEATSRVTNAATDRAMHGNGFPARLHRTPPRSVFGLGTLGRGFFLEGASAVAPIIRKGISNARRPIFRPLFVLLSTSWFWISRPFAPFKKICLFVFFTRPEADVTAFV